MTTIQYKDENDKLVGDEGVVTLPASLKTIGQYAFGNNDQFFAVEGGCDSITHIIVPSTVTSIGNYAFTGCKSLQVVEYYSATLMASIRAAATYVFADCTSLEKVILNDAITNIGGYIFQNCTSLKTIMTYNADSKQLTGVENVVTLPAGLTTIGAGAFMNSGVEQIAIPEFIEIINSYVFQNCEFLTTVWLSDRVLTIDSYAFDGCTLLTAINTENVTGVGAYAFRNCVSLETIDLSSLVQWPTTAGEAGYSFYGCTDLSSVTLGEYLSEIADYTFYGCESLTKIELPSLLLNIGEGAFANSGLTEIFVPYSVRSIGNAALGGIGKIVVDDENSVYETVDGTLYLKSTEEGVADTVVVLSGVTGVYTVTDDMNLAAGAFFGLNDITEVKISADKVVADMFIGYAGKVTITGGTAIADYAFRGYLGSEIVLSEGITSIGAYAFYENVNLVSVNIPEGITSIGAYAFYGNTNLLSITIPASTLTIGNYAFANSGLQTVSMYGGQEIGQYAFAGTTALNTIVLPEGVKTIRGGAFYGSGLTGSITIPNTVTTLGDNVFLNCDFITEICIEDGEETLTLIMDLNNTARALNNAFGGLIGLRKVVLARITSLPGYAFYNCISLETVIINEGVTEIGNFVFQNCSSLTDLTLPKSLTTIGQSVFDGCTSISELVLSTNVVSVLKNAFSGWASTQKIIIETTRYSVSNWTVSWSADCNATIEIIVADETADDAE